MKRTTHLSFAILASVIPIAGCHPKAPVQLDVASAYDTVRVQIVSGTPVVLMTVTVRNLKTDTAIFDAYQRSVEHLQANGWKTVDVPLSAGPSPVWSIGPGNSVQIPIRIEDSRSMQVLTRRGPLVTGTYRLSFPASRKSSSTSARIVRSAPFVVVVPDATPSNTR
jgi:hypothetical protein